MPRECGSSNDEIEGNKDQFLIIGIGASAGGPEVCQKILDLMPTDSGMAFILVQHLAPSHENTVAERLSSHTKMQVHQAVEGMPVEPNCVYVVPPGTSWSIVDGLFHMPAAHEKNGARLPFDFLLRSLAEQIGERAVGVVLSGTGADGSVGLGAIKENRGFIIAQDPSEAEFDSMPRRAIATGLVDRVLPVAKIPEALISYRRWMQRGTALPRGGISLPGDAPDFLTQILEFIRTNSAYDFTLYKRGTLERRIKSRMAMLEIEPEDMGKYLECLKQDPHEIDTLAKDLLINVTNFFRDADVFNLLAEKIVPEMIENAKPGVTLRIWSVGCSTGEETYSLVMIFLEQIAKSQRPIKLQVFASDIDSDAIQTARQGLYPETIAEDVSPARLARFFTVEGTGYRVSQRLRESVVFTVQDVLADPPFSRIDMVSCRNVLIYLLPDAQAKVISQFDFALNDQGVLLLGAAEALGSHDDQFQPIFKKERIYRHIGRRTRRFPDASSIPNREPRPHPRTDVARTLSRQTFLADICRRLVVESFAPSSVLINEKQQCIFTFGATAHYFRVVSGHPTNDIMEMVHDDVRSHLRKAISRGAMINDRVEVEGGQINREGRTISFHMTVQPIRSDGENFFLICFIETPVPTGQQAPGVGHHDPSRIAELEKELAAKKIEIATARYNVEALAESQMIIHHEALSANEEFQATNEELLASKEELQSLNEELSALNTQLQETLQQQRRTSNDLQKVFFTTDVATIFLDTDLNIRFFTPATRAVFNIIQVDIGRPLSDLSPLSTDAELLDDAKSVLKDRSPRQREIKARHGRWFNRRILPYRTNDDQIDGIVITYHDISQQMHTAGALKAACKLAEMSSATKSSFLAAASHDLRQPLQTLVLLHGMLESAINNSDAKKLVTRIGTTLASVSGMLNSLLDINRIDAGIIPVEKIDFEIGDLLNRLSDEFSYHAEAKGLEFHVVHCQRQIISDPPLLEQILRNLLANAIKFTNEGKVLLGCRRHGEALRIEIWDTGVGIAKEDTKSIFNEYHQLADASTNADYGLGLGLAIVDRIARLLEHRVSVASRPGRGTVFTVEVELAAGNDGRAGTAPIKSGIAADADYAATSYNIVLIEDEPDLLELFAGTFNSAGHVVKTARNSASLNRILTAATVPPDIIIANFNLRGSTNGLQLAIKFREKFNHDVPVIILTGDISSDTRRRIAQEHCQHVHKPVSPRELERVMRRLIEKAKPWPRSRKNPRLTDEVTVNVIDDDAVLREKLSAELEQDGRIVKLYATSEAFLEDYQPGGMQCLILDAYLPGMSGLKLLQHLADVGSRLPTIMITGLSDTETAVRAMKAGALDFIEKPIKIDALRESIAMALKQSAGGAARDAYLADIADRYKRLTPRQRQVMELVLEGYPSKNIAADLGISQRTVEKHRAAVMAKTDSASLPALVRFAGALAELKPTSRQSADLPGSRRGKDVT